MTNSQLPLLRARCGPPFASLLPSRQTHATILGPELVEGARQRLMLYAGAPASSPHQLIQPANPALSPSSSYLGLAGHDFEDQVYAGFGLLGSSMQGECVCIAYHQGGPARRRVIYATAAQCKIYQERACSIGDMSPVCLSVCSHSTKVCEQQLKCFFSSCQQHFVIRRESKQELSVNELHELTMSITHVVCVTHHITHHIIHVCKPCFQACPLPAHTLPHSIHIRPSSAPLLRDPRSCDTPPLSFGKMRCPFLPSPPATDAPPPPQLFPAGPAASWATTCTT